MKEALSIFKFWRYFACMEKDIKHHSILKTLLACNIHVKIKKRLKGKKAVEVEYGIKEVAEFKSKIFKWLNEFTETYNIGQKENLTKVC